MNSPSQMVFYVGLLFLSYKDRWMILRKREDTGHWKRKH
jgi:hypothetical protein